MPLLGRGQVSSATNPLLPFYGVSGGWLVDVFALEFQVWSSTSQVYPLTPGSRQSVNLTSDRVTKGRYAAAWTVANDQALGAYTVRWFYRLVSGGPELSAVSAFEVVTAPPLPGPYYGGLVDLAAEEALSSILEPRRIHALGVASRLLERFTGTFFEPRYGEWLFDGSGGSLLHLMHAVSAVASVTRDGADVDASGVVVYNRHLSGMFSPDDRLNPKLARKAASWPRGAQNIAVAGVFGCVEPGYAPWGDPHPIARHATKLLALRELLPMGSGDRDAWRDRHRVLSESTRDQSVTMGAITASSGGAGGGVPFFTGDPEIDQLIMHLRRPIYVGAA